ncbi:hypothetical protein ASF68_16005 [Plantibacter sp. Leaf314]|nr:hypothetical protein ASF68_16005 [Plantibacter sp. Leaf314]
MLEHLDSQSFIVETYVRTVAPLTPEFIEGIRRFNVTQPIIARRDEHGNVLVGVRPAPHLGQAGRHRTRRARCEGANTLELPGFRSMGVL